MVKKLQIANFKFANSELGSALAWTAIFLAFVLLPLLTLVGDGARLVRVRNRLQTAADAACEDAAWSAADYRTFKQNGTTTFERNPFWLGRAQTTFQRSLVEQNLAGYSAALVVSPDYANAFMNCQARASVQLSLGLGVQQLSVASHARIRFRAAP